MKTPTLDQQREIFHRSILPANADDALASKLWHVFRAGVLLGSKGKIPKFEASLCQGRAYPVIPASVIWGRWDKVKAIFGNKTDAWMRLIRIAAAGDEGLTHKALFPNTNGWTILKNCLEAKIIETREVRDVLNRRQLRIVITRKGLAFLRLAAASAHCAQDGGVMASNGS